MGQGDGFGAAGADADGGFGGAEDIGGVGEGTGGGTNALAAAATDGALGTSFGGGLGPAAGNLMRNNLMGRGLHSSTFSAQRYTLFVVYAGGRLSGCFEFVSGRFYHRTGR